MRCPACGARNVADAAWCTQCFERLDGTGPPTAEVEVEAEDPTPPSPVPADPTDGGDRDVRVRGEVVEWRCTRCGGWSELTRATCTRCDAPRAGFGDPVPTVRRGTRVALWVVAALVALGTLVVVVVALLAD